MSRHKQSPFAGITTREEFTEVLQKQLGNLTTADTDAAKLLCKLKGWNTPAETSEASVVEVESSPTVAAPEPPKGDGGWHWRDDIDGDREAVIRILNANVDYPQARWVSSSLPPKPWQGPLTTAEMATKYDEIAAANKKAVLSTGDENVRRWLYICGTHCWISVITPKGLQKNICCTLPCDAAYLEKINDEPPPDNSHW